MQPNSRGNIFRLLERYGISEILARGRWQWLLSVAAWFFCSVILWYSAGSPCSDACGMADFIRFHALVSVWFCLIFVLFHHARCQRHKFQVIATGIFSLAVGILFVKSLAVSPLTAAPLPNFFLLWVFLSIYLTTLVLCLNFFYAFSLGHVAPLVLGLAAILSLGNLFYSDILLFFDAQKHASLFLYFNPSVVVASCFPGYDYLRSSLFYQYAPFGTCLGSFRYPDALNACLYYGVAALTLGSIAFLRRYCWRKKALEKFA